MRRNFLLLAALLVAGFARAEPAANAPFAPPTIVAAPPAVYPAALAERGREGEVILTIDLDARGAVTAVAVERSSGEPAFDDAAREAARHFVFHPATAGGKFVAARITYRYRFHLTAPPPPPVEDRAPTAPRVPFGGVVRERGTRAPLARVEVTVAMPAGDLTALTDEEGRFAFEAVPAGKRAVRVRGANHVTADTDEELRPGRRLEVTYWLVPLDRYRTVVRGERLVKQTLEQTLDIEEIKRIPGTQGDALKAVQTLPGVARAPFGLGQLIVWGSSPGDTRTYVDGVYIPTLYHFAGLRSTVNSELVQSLTFTPGGFGADFGRGIGGVVEIETRRPKEQGVHGYVALDLIDGSLLLEAKLTKRLEIAVAARRSWIDVFLPLFTTNDFQLSPRYWDYQLALHYKATPRDELDVFAFGSDDQIDLLLKTPDPALTAQFSSHTFYHRLLARWTHRFAGGATLTVTPSVGYDVPFEVKGQIGAASFHVDPSIFQYDLRAVARVPFGQWLRLDAGLDFEGNYDPIDVAGLASGMPREGDRSGFGGSSSLISTNTNLHLISTAPYLVANFRFLDGRLLISPGLRLDVYWLGGYRGTPESFGNTWVELEPRLQARYQFNRYVAIKGALGAYHQPPDPASLLRGFGNPGVAPESSFQYVLGVEIQPYPSLKIEATGFYKDMRSLIVRSDQPGVVLDNLGQGRVYGGELLVRQQLARHFFGWLSYTLSRAERRDRPGEAWRLFDFDQTHILSLVASYQLPRGFQIGARFRFVTGNPTTPVAQWWYDASNDFYQSVLGPRNSARLASFNQLDLRFDKVWTFKYWRFSIYLDIQNVYNAANPESIQYAPRPEDGTKPIAGLPFFPSLGVRGDF